MAKARRVIDIELEEIGRLRGSLDASFEKSIHLIMEALERRNKVVVLGVGKSGHIGEKIAATLTSTGCPAIPLNPLNALHGDLGVLNDGDVVLALSNSGDTEELTNLLPALGRFDVRIVAITGNPASLLARHAEVSIIVKVEKEACPMNLAPTSSTTAMLVMGDALAMVLLEARGFNKEDFARFHPGGHLGMGLLLRVRQIMRGADKMAVVSEGATVRDALAGMTTKRGGVAVIVAADGSLVGVFSQGDFVRHFQTDPEVGEKLVSDYMTRNPVTIGHERLAVEVLNLLERHRIDDLVVVNETNVPQGIVDSQDLARFKLL